MEIVKLTKPAVAEDATRKIADVLRSGDLVQGRWVKEFEGELRKYLNISNVVIGSSGTAFFLV